MNKFLNYLALFTSMSIAGIAAYFSVIGLATIFAGAFLGVVVMAGALEFGKIITAAYLHLYWDRLNYMKYYLTFSVFILMLITSLGIFGYLAKASSDTSYKTAVAQSELQKIDGKILRTGNSISLLEERMNSLGTSKIDVSESIKQQEVIRDGAWDRVQGDIDYAQGQIDSLRNQLTSLDEAVNELRNKGVEVITTDEGGLFQGDEKQTIDYVVQANALFDQQKEQREQIREDIKAQQNNIDRYRSQAQETINSANAEIKSLQEASTGDADEIITKTTEYQLQIDELYDTINVYKEERFPFEQEILNFEREVGPIKYVAEVIYGQETARDYIDNAIRWVIFAIIFVFDPLAILLLITSIGLIAHPKTGTVKPKTVENRYVLQVPKDKILNMKKPK
jgi:predicted  nucleic acid-binding Zn-ribbon protein